MLLYLNLGVEQKFSKLPYKREKKFPTQKYWSNRPILMLTFFYFDISNPTDTFITDNWGEREDTQKVLVAICTLEYFSWLYTFIFFRCFSFFVFSGTSFFQCSYRTYFSNHSTKEGKIFCSQNGSQFAVFRCYQKPRLIWTWIDNVNTVWWQLSNNTITRDTVEDNTQEFRIAVDC